MSSESEAGDEVASMPAGEAVGASDASNARGAGSGRGSGVGATQFRIGVGVTCSDGVAGDLGWVVVDPVARAVTHLVVEPKHRQGLGRLVPVEMAAGDADELRLSCTTEEFEQLPRAEETQFLPAAGGGLGYGAGEAVNWPYYGLGIGGAGMSMGGVGMVGAANAIQPIVYDRVPVGEVQVRRGDKVHAADGDIGSVQGLVIFGEDHHVTHVLLQEGHLFGRKQVAIPITAVTKVGDQIQVSLTKQEIGELPEVEVETAES